MTEDTKHTHAAHSHTHGHVDSALTRAESAASGTRYTCPMHPEIIRDAPGSCPKCGMALVPVAGTGEADDSELRDLTRRLWAGVALSIPLVLLAMSPMIGIHEPFGLLLSPIFAGAAMALSSVSVVTNALRLNRVKL